MRARQAEPALVAAALGAVYLIWQPPSADLAAQLFRTELFERTGFTVWNNQWFAGHHVPAYSVLFPPLAALLGPRLVAVLACMVAAALFERLAEARYRERARLGAVWFGAAATVSLFTGRLTYALGVALGLGALLALQRERRVAAPALGVLCAMGSPVAALFLALVAGAQGVAARRRDAVVLAAASVGAAAILQLLFPEPGVARFLLSTLWPIVAFAGLVVVLVDRDERTLRLAAVLYAGACLVGFVVDSPMGGHAARLGTMFGPPALALALWPRRRLALALLAAPLLYWQWQAPVRDTTTAIGDPAITAGFYEPLNRFLARRVSPGGRVHVPYTRNHWENYWVARRIPVARGWERQHDARVNALFYASEDRLDPVAYRRWLERVGVEYVAVPRPGIRLDYTGIPEARLVRRGLPFLEAIWSSRDWRVYRVRRPPPSGPIVVVAQSPDSFTLRATRPGSLTVAFRHTPYWTLAAGAACVQRTPDGFTRVRIARAGTVVVRARLNPLRWLRPRSTCRRG